MDDAYYRQVLAQMQSEYSRAVAALEKQVAALSRHNELLTEELRQTKQQKSDWATKAQALTHQVNALNSLLQQEQDYWKRYDKASKDDRDRLTKQLAEAKAEAIQHHEVSRTLRREMKALQNRVGTAVATSNSFEQRLLVVVKEKQQSVQDAENQLAHYKKKLHGKRAQNKYLTEALVRLQERQSDSSSYGSSPTTVSARGTTGTPMSAVTSSPKMEVSKPEVPQLRRVRKRELTLPEEIKNAAATVTTSTSSRMYKSKRMGSSRAGTSPTSSSPEISPRSARAAPYKRAPSVATTTPTTSDGNSFNSNVSSSGSLRSLRSLRNVTGRRISSRNSSDSDNIDVSPRTAAGRVPGNPTGRLERELSGLRRKLDSCMADAAARW